MKKDERKRFDKLYNRHLRLLKLQGKGEKTNETDARAVRRSHIGEILSSSLHSSGKPGYNIYANSR